jgi:tRNA modification GTPase
VVEQIGVDRAREYAAQADLVIYVIDASTDLDESDDAIMELLQDKKAIILLNKSDLDMKVTEEDVKKRLDKKMISISAKEQIGLDDLEETIKEMFFQGEVTFNDEVYAINIRQKTSLTIAQDHLQQVIRSIEDGMPEDFYSIDLMGAYEELGKIIGESVEDDLVDEIFSKFCMGK